MNFNIVLSSPQTDSLPDIENILRISLECKALLNALHVDSSPRQTQRDSEDASGEVGMLNNKALRVCVNFGFRDENAVNVLTNHSDFFLANQVQSQYEC